MAGIYEWLGDIDQPMDGIFVEDDPMDQITLLNTDQNGNMYFDMPPMWNSSMEQHRTYDEYIPIDPSLATMTNPPAPTTLGQTIIMVPEQLAEASRKVLIYFAKVLDIPEISEDEEDEFAEETTFTMEELEALEPIAEEDLESPSFIGGICFNMNPKTTEIKDVIDMRRIGSDRRTVYLAKDANEKYYWFHPPRMNRDPHLSKLIGNYRRRSQAETTRRETRGIK